MKIAFLHHSFIIGSGIDSLIYQYAKRMSLEHHIEIFTFRSYYKLPIDPYKINIIDIPFGKTRIGSGVLAPVFIPWRKIRRELEQFDVVIAQLYPANLIPILPKKLRTKVIIIEWGIPEGVWLTWQERLYTRLSKQASRLACRRADKVLVSSKFMQDYVKDNFNVDAKCLCIDGLDFELLDKNKYKASDTNNIVYVGRISPHKNIHTLLSAFKTVQNTIPEASLTIIGSHTFPEYSKKLKQLASKLNIKVNWTGAVSWKELPQYYADCSVYCSPSLWEGFMRCEAFAFEKPMVVFNNTANPETVHNNINGIVVNYNNSTALAEALIRLLLNKEENQAMGQAGYRWARENLDFNNITKELLNELGKTD